ncbi:MFS transporter [Actinobacillus succinogenes]|uniref:Major facilitator superfamily MFS_1 n=1 Tax=Actinobacillus succinogenes (strain ATCC 55618 / DSM 22257 / CCUG 43843 / 130Z) TaxID=339671 RepID=A6VNY7_ACTSZ|nr:YbfB/YjiJ family MFS transporter [Actinobacillus succinogenes]ABR74684.1 major facilitator superfamily MFS_1 [Actinobacillus succinogenes 130Z]PHI40894.1 MFS transporter [Actinobacillus succinogenes]
MQTQKSILWFIFAGLSASLISIGLARFAYTPLLPLLISENWFSASDAAYLGAANLAGYLIGALFARPMGNAFSNKQTLRVMMLLVTLSFFACAFPISTAWYFVWRLISGISGGTIMVLVAATITPHVPAERRNLAGGAIFLGIGLGIFASATIVPMLIDMGLKTTWFGLGIFSAILTALSWFNIPDPIVSVQEVADGDVKPHAVLHAEEPKKAFLILYLQYGLMAVFIVAPAVFIVDYIARGLQLGAGTGALFWGLYGIGSMIGPPLYGYFADKFGAKPTLRGVLAVEFLAVFVLCATENIVAMAVLTVIIGSFPPGIVPLMLARIFEMTTCPRLRNVNWSKATVFFATAQALAGYGLSAVFSATNNDHRVLFFIGGVALVISLIMESLHRKA